MLCDLLTDNRKLTRFMRLAHRVCDRYNDVATASLIEAWIDEAERRTWFLAMQILMEDCADLSRSFGMSAPIQFY
jgi:DNA-binding ferritin-like protein